MIKVFFVRHVKPEQEWEDDRTRPLTAEGKIDSQSVKRFLEDRKIDSFYSSPYKRSVDTIADSAVYFGKEIHIDERFRKDSLGL